MKLTIAPTAQVARGFGGQGDLGQRLAMQKDERGIWSATTDTLKARHLRV